MHKQKYSELGDKPHKILAKQLRKQEQDSTIKKALTDPRHINNHYFQFYQSLYAKQNIDVV